MNLQQRLWRFIINKLKEKMEYEILDITDELKKEVRSLAEKDLDDALRIKDKLEKYARIDEINDAGELTDNEITGVLGELVNNGEYYFEYTDGKLVPNNNNEETELANSYIPILSQLGCSI